MEILTIDIPTLYGDHHVMAVRQLLLEIPGIKDVYASSCFQVVRLTYDPGLTDASTIRARLGEAGYLADVAVPLETSADRQAAHTTQTHPYAASRHTVVYPQTGQVIGFAQEHQHGEKRA